MSAPVTASSASTWYRWEVSSSPVSIVAPTNTRPSSATIRQGNVAGDCGPDVLCSHRSPPVLASYARTMTSEVVNEKPTPAAKTAPALNDQRSDQVAAAARIHAILPRERSGAGIVGTDNPVQVAPSIGAGTADEQQPVSRCHRRAARKIGPPSEVEDVFPQQRAVFGGVGTNDPVIAAPRHEHRTRDEYPFMVGRDTRGELVEAAFPPIFPGERARAVIVGTDHEVPIAEHSHESGDEDLVVEGGDGERLFEW